MAKSECELPSEISSKLDRLIGLYAAQGKTQGEQIVVLKHMGFDWKFIGSVVGLQADAARKRHARQAKDKMGGGCGKRTGKDN